MKETKKYSTYFCQYIKQNVKKNNSMDNVPLLDRLDGQRTQP